MSDRYRDYVGTRKYYQDQIKYNTTQISKIKSQINDLKKSRSLTKDKLTLEIFDEKIKKLDDEVFSLECKIKNDESTLKYTKE